ncbi:MAG: STAS domain-containing protein [bacterium]|nr:STAS domain-containing protein [bacterium]
MSFKLKKSDGISLIEINFDVTTGNISELKQLVNEILVKENPLLVFKFLPGATFLCSAGIGLIATIYKEITKKNGKMAMCGMSMDINEIFERVRLNHLIKSFKEEEDAVKYVKS